jgi:Zn-dependent M16 (insulinase) family peptidase
MQSFENTANSIIHRATKRAVYPEKCGYNVDTGGALKNLRTSVTNEKVKNYHASLYRPENVWVIVAGDVGEEDVFGAVAAVDAKLASKVSK